METKIITLEELVLDNDGKFVSKNNNLPVGVNPIGKPFIIQTSPGINPFDDIRRYLDDYREDGEIPTIPEYMSSVGILIGEGKENWPTHNYYYPAQFYEIMDED